MIADSLEEVDVRVQDAVSSGADGTQVFFAATLRQVLPALARVEPQMVKLREAMIQTCLSSTKFG